MGVRDRRARQKQLLRQQILDAARALLVREGYDSLSMRRVAERIDYSPTAIYLHFKDKQELVFSLCEESFAKLVHELETLADEYPDPLVRLRKGMERYVAFGLKNPNHYIPAFVVPPPADLHDKVRLLVTVTGVVFAVVLIVVELGLFLGFTTTTSGLIDRSRADLWITGARVPYIEMGVPYSERKLSTVLATPGVRQATKYIVRFSQWQRPDGRQESVQVVGFDPGQTLGGPWNVVEGRAADLKAADNVIVDELYKSKLGVSRIGEVFEIRGHRARVVGFTSGIRSFTTSPYVFTSFKNAQDFVGLREDQTYFLLVKLAPGADVEKVRRAIRDQVRDNEV